MTVTVPVVDFKPFLDGTPNGKLQTGKAVVKAMSETGFLYLRNHGIPEQDQKRMFEWSKTFFDLETEQKQKCPHPANGEHHRGWSGVGKEKVVQMVFDKEEIEQLRQIPDVKESFEIGNEKNKDFCNIWPDEQDIPGFKEFSLYYFKLSEVCSKNILRALALGMDLDEDFFLSYHSTSNNQLRLLHYPPTLAQDLREGRAERIAAHTDFGTFTMLLQDECGGLQVEEKDNPGSFVDAPYIPNTLVINTGDFLMRWSNDKLKSTLHRVTAPPSSPETGYSRVRYSIPYFVSADRDRVVSALPGTCSDGTQAKYEPITAGEYLSKRLNATY